MMRSLIVMTAALFAVVVPVVAAADPLRPPNGTYRYELRIAGAVAGQSTVVVRGGADAFVVDDDSRFTAVNVNGHAIARYANASLALVSYSADFVLPSGSQHSDVTVAPGHMTIVTGSQHVDVAADSSAPLEVLGDNLAGTAVIVPAIVQAAHTTRFTYAALSGGIAVPATVVPDTIPARPIGLLSRDLWLVVDAGKIREVFWYDPATFVVDALDIPAQSIEFRLVGPIASDRSLHDAPPAL
jgi:hypothetical protein